MVLKFSVTGTSSKYEEISISKELSKMKSDKSALK